jgi:hypothetical protein
VNIPHFSVVMVLIHKPVAAVPDSENIWAGCGEVPVSSAHPTSQVGTHQFQVDLKSGFKFWETFPLPPRE